VAPVLWSAALLLAGQGVWNLAPVLVTARLADTPALAAGFTTAAVIVRAPVLLFPTVQALLLPRLAANNNAANNAADNNAADNNAADNNAANGNAALPRTPRPLLAGLGVAGLLWVAIAAVAVPWVAELVFATTAPPPAWVLAVLALSTLLGAVAQVVQAHLVAARRTHAAALAWLGGLLVLLAVGLLAGPPVAAATIGQFVAAAAVLGGMVLARRIR
jgi:O-antigen/teichoic acid export membrane protein